MTLDDGVEGGVRMLKLRTGPGLKFNVLIDHSFDIADCEYKGQSIGWHPPLVFEIPLFMNIKAKVAYRG